MFADPTGRDENASLKETDGSWRARRGSTIGLTATEQQELRAVMQESIQKELEEMETSNLVVQFDDDEPDQERSK